ncbi:MAG: gamma-glutamyltransferase [Actinomycetota bacterium]|nr:gamma-glutamyltransferase [Actinomycetota bacterium]
MRRISTALLAAGALMVGLVTPAAPATSAPRAVDKDPVAVGYGGAVSTVDPEATRVGLRVLRRGGNAVDAAVAAAATLGVTEPYSAGIGGGGFFAYYDARSNRVHTIDGRETAPMAMEQDAFIDPATGEPYPFFPQRVTSGISVGVPGTPRTWELALDLWGKRSLKSALRPAIRVARRGFVVDETFRDQTADNAERFAQIQSTAALFLPGGAPPEPGSIFRNRDLARTYRLMARRGVDVFYRGPIARDIVRTVQDPPTTADATLPVPPGVMTLQDMRSYVAPVRRPTKVGYRGYQVYGMGPPSSGGPTVGEALNILERFRLSGMSRTQAMHHYLEASALAFADRNRYVGDPRYVDVPLRQLLSDKFAAERACRISPTAALPKPVEPGTPDGEYDGTCASAGAAGAGDGGKSTTHLTVADRWGNVVAYTLTIEQTGGSGIVVPGRGFLLNNELTDFNATPAQGDAPDPNLIEGGKRPRSSMAPTIVLRRGEPVLAVGSPGGSTIITTVLQILVNRLDLGMTLPEAIAAPRASQRNTPTVSAEPDFDQQGLRALGHTFTATEEIGAAAGVEFLRHGRLLAAAEPKRRGGGDAGVVRARR